MVEIKTCYVGTKALILTSSYLSLFQAFRLSGWHKEMWAWKTARGWVGRHSLVSPPSSPPQYFFPTLSPPSALHYLNAWNRLWLPWRCLLFSLWESFFFSHLEIQDSLLTSLNSPSVIFFSYFGLTSWLILRASFMWTNNLFCGPLALSDLILLWINLNNIFYLCVFFFR